jgi:hypothetical protein
MNILSVYYGSHTVVLRSQKYFGPDRVLNETLGYAVVLQVPQSPRLPSTGIGRSGTMAPASPPAAQTPMVHLSQITGRILASSRCLSGERCRRRLSSPVLRVRQSVGEGLGEGVQSRVSTG